MENIAAKVEKRYKSAKYWGELLNGVHYWGVIGGFVLYDSHTESFRKVTKSRVTAMTL